MTFARLWKKAQKLMDPSSKRSVVFRVQWLDGQYVPEAISMAKDSGQDLSREHFVWQMAQGHNIAIAAYAEIDFVGWMMFALRGRRLHIKTLVVKEDWRGLGVGTALVDRAQGWMESRWNGAYKQMYVEVNEYDLQAQIFFRSCGFEWSKTVRTIHGDSYLLVWNRVTS